MQRGYIGRSHQIFLATIVGLQRLARDEFKLEIPSFADKVLYNAAFLTGAKEFVSYFATDGIDLEKYVGKHWAGYFRPSDAGFELTVGRQVAVLLKEHAVAPEKEADTAWIHAFLTGLICTLQHGSSMISVAPLPRPTDVSNVLNPELAVPVNQLLACLISESASLPVPVEGLDRTKASRFLDLLRSGAFGSYSNAHRTLSLSGDPTLAIADIEIAAASLRDSSSDLLHLRPTQFHLLGLFSSVIDILSDLLPRGLANVVRRGCAAQLESRKNIVIYRFDTWLSGSFASLLRVPGDWDMQPLIDMLVKSGAVSVSKSGTSPKRSVSLECDPEAQLPGKWSLLPKFIEQLTARRETSDDIAAKDRN